LIRCSISAYVRENLGGNWESAVYYAKKSTVHNSLYWVSVQFSWATIDLWLIQ